MRFLGAECYTTLVSPFGDLIDCRFHLISHFVQVLSVDKESAIVGEANTAHPTFGELTQEHIERNIPEED